MRVLDNRVTIGDLHMDQLDLFNTTTVTANHEITISPAQHEIMQALVSGDLDRATQLIDLQHDTDLDLQ
jgi:hypothetical protein